MIFIWASKLNQAKSDEALFSYKWTCLIDIEIFIRHVHFYSLFRPLQRVDVSKYLFLGCVGLFDYKQMRSKPEVHCCLELREAIVKCCLFILVCKYSGIFNILTVSQLQQTSPKLILLCLKVFDLNRYWYMN